MPCDQRSDSPHCVRDNLPSHAEHIYQEAYNSAWDQDDHHESRAHGVAWGAVEKRCHKNDEGDLVEGKRTNIIRTSSRGFVVRGTEFGYDGIVGWDVTSERPGRTLMAREFTVMVERDPESGWLIAEVEELPGCFTEAPDLAALHAHLWEAITGYLEVADPGSAELTDFIERWHVRAVA